MQLTPVDPALQNELKAGEQLLWWGKPDLAHSIKSSNRLATFMVIWSVLAAVTLVLCLVSALLLRKEIQLSAMLTTTSIAGLEVATLILLLISLVVFGLCFYRIYLLRKGQQKHATDIKNTLYGITNQRVIVITAQKQGLTVASYTREDIGQISRVETGGGWGDVTYSKPRQIQRGGRSVAVVSKLAGIPNVRMVDDLLTRTFKNAAPPAPLPPSPQHVPPSPVQYPPPPEQYTQPQAQKLASPAPQEEK